MKIDGLGPVTAAGNGAAAMTDALEGRASPHVEIEQVGPPTGLTPIPVYKTSDRDLERFVSKRDTRRLDGFSRNALLAAFLAVEDAAMSFPEPERVGVVFGTAHGPLESSFGFLDSAIADGDRGASPVRFALSVHNAAAAHIAARLNLRGPTLTLSAFSATFANVLTIAATWLKNHDADYVLAGVGETWHPLVGYAVASDGAPETDRVRPLDFTRRSYCPGEGAAMFLLSAAGMGRRGEIERIHQDLTIAEAAAAFPEIGVARLAATGDPRSGRDYRALTRRFPETAVARSAAAVYGSVPGVAGAMETIAAALSASSENPTACFERTRKGRFDAWTVQKYRP